MVYDQRDNGEGEVRWVSWVTKHCGEMGLCVLWCYSLWSPLLLYSLMAAGTNEHLKHSVLHLGGMIQWLNELPQLVIEGMRGLISDFVLHPPLRHWLQTVQFQPDHRTGLPYQLIESAGPPALMPPSQHTTAKTSIGTVRHLPQPQGKIDEVLKDSCKLPSTRSENPGTDVVWPTGFVGLESGELPFYLARSESVTGRWCGMQWVKVRQWLSCHGGRWWVLESPPHTLNPPRVDY